MTDATLNYGSQAGTGLKDVTAWVCHVSGIPETSANAELVRTYVRHAFAGMVMFANKQRDYGPGNIAGGGSLGVVIRMRDKIERLLNLAGKPAANEAKTDSANDLHVYGAILAMVMDGEWPDTTKNPRLTI